MIIFTVVGSTRSTLRTLNSSSSPTNTAMGSTDVASDILVASLL
jgi:hypothetical protein